MKQQIDYKQYLASREWRVKRNEVIELNNGICERCASRPIQDIHHLTYERIGQERISDLMGVCRPCHEYLAAVRDSDPALDAITSLISEYGIFPYDDSWPTKASCPVFLSGGLLNGHRLWMQIYPESHMDIIQEFCQGLPRAQVCQGAIAIFSWSEDE